MQYIHTHQYQHNKRNNLVCGDAVMIKRNKESTIVVVMDGVGSGIHANICATMFGHELMHFLKKDYSLLESCRLVIESIKTGKKNDNFAAFAVANILHTGYVQMVTYESPSPIFINGNFAYLPTFHVHQAGSENLIESNCMLGPNKALILFSDGVSNAGMGHGFGEGIGSQGAADKLNELLISTAKYERAAEKLLEYCHEISGYSWADDTSMVVIRTRNAVTANILTGPPSSKEADIGFIADFDKARGFKIICGSTTLDIYKRYTGAASEMVESFNPFEAPCYKVPNINFASEGAIMLNQLYNLYELNPKNLDTNAPITQLKELIDMSDKICFYMGNASNVAQNESMIFSQLRIFPRTKIVHMLSDKFRELGKIVEVKEY